MSLVSLIWGFLAFCGMIAGYYPVFVAVNWLNLPFAAGALIFSLAALFKTKGMGAGEAIAGLTASGIAVVIGVIRITLGNGML